MTINQQCSLRNKPEMFNRDWMQIYIALCDLEKINSIYKRSIPYISEQSNACFKKLRVLLV
jgi:hypothetical protein